MDRCSHICVPAPRHPHIPALVRRETRKGFSDNNLSMCLCPGGMRLAENGATCTKDGSGLGVEEHVYTESKPRLENNTLFYALVIGITAFATAILILVVYIGYKKMSKGSGWSETSSQKSSAPSRSLYHPPIRASMGKFHESESMVPLRQSPASDISPYSPDLETV